MPEQQTLLTQVHYTIQLTPSNMKKILFALLLIPALSFGQTVPISLVALSTVTDLRTFPPQTSQMVQLLGLTTLADGNGGNYYWSATSTATDDGFITVQVTGITTGRWLRIGNSNTLKGSASFSAVALQSTYTVPFGITFPFTPRTVIVIPRSTNAGLGYSIGTITTSNFTITFNSVPLLGTLNCDFVIVKQ